MKTVSTLSTGAALQAGLRLFKGSGALFALLFGARAIQGLVEATLGPAFVASLESTSGLGSPVAASALLLWLLAELAGACALALAAVSAGRRLLGREHAFAAAALGYFFVGGAVLIAVRLWTWTALGASLWAFGLALLTGERGGVSALALALALTVGLPLGLLATLWTRQGLARAGVTGEGYLVSLHGALLHLRTRPWPLIGVLVVAGVVGGVLSLVAGMMLLPFSATRTYSSAQELGWAVSVLGAALGALGTSFGQLWGFNALCALEASGQGTLSDEFQPVVSARPVAAQPISWDELTAERILAARPFPPPPTVLLHAPSDSIVEATSVPEASPGNEVDEAEGADSVPVKLPEPK
ncbi:MAG: hypothetical protein M3Y59_18100 [Myxococcota bacterium]|nr:hypothetical protein [Myxococcota bacterium]